MADPEPAAPPPPPPPPKLVVATGTGAFAEAYQQVVLTPFAAKTGVEIKSATEDGQGPEDLVLLDATELEKRCSNGELLPLDVAVLAPDKEAAISADDFLDGALRPCGIGALSWSHLFVYDPAKVGQATTRRRLKMCSTHAASPASAPFPPTDRGWLEALLIADGVAPDDVYTTLETGDGANRVLKRLKSLGQNIIWYEQLPQAVAAIRKGEATLALTSNGHAFIEQARSGPLGLIWQGQVLHPAFFAIPKTAKDADRVKELVAFASAPTQLAALARQIPYGPMRKSAIAATTVMRHAVTGQDLAPFLPTSPQHL